MSSDGAIKEALIKAWQTRTPEQVMGSLLNLNGAQRARKAACTPSNQSARVSAH